MGGRAEGGGAYGLEVGGDGDGGGNEGGCEDGGDGCGEAVARAAVAGAAQFESQRLLRSSSRTIFAVSLTQTGFPRGLSHVGGARCPDTAAVVRDVQCGTRLRWRRQWRAVATRAAVLTAVQGSLQLLAHLTIMTTETSLQGLG